MFVEIRNPSAVELLNYRVTHCENSPEKVLMRFSMEMREGGLMEWMVHEVRPRYNTADWTQGPKPAEHTILELELRPTRAQYRRSRLLWFFLPLPLPKRRDSHLQDSGPRELGGRGKRSRQRVLDAELLRAFHHSHRIGGPILLDGMVYPRLRKPQRVSVRSSPDRTAGVFIYGVTCRGSRHLGFRSGAHQVAL